MDTHKLALLCRRLKELFCLTLTDVTAAGIGNSKSTTERLLSGSVLSVWHEQFISAAIQWIASLLKIPADSLADYLDGKASPDIPLLEHILLSEPYAPHPSQPSEMDVRLTKCNACSGRLLYLSTTLPPILATGAAYRQELEANPALLLEPHLFQRFIPRLVNTAKLQYNRLFGKTGWLRNCEHLFLVPCSRMEDARDGRGCFAGTSNDWHDALLHKMSEAVLEKSIRPVKILVGFYREKALTPALAALLKSFASLTVLPEQCALATFHNFAQSFCLSQFSDSPQAKHIHGLHGLISDLQSLVCNDIEDMDETLKVIRSFAR